MSIVAIVNLAERLLNQTFGQDQASQSGPASPKGVRAQDTGAPPEDHFTSTAQAAQSGQTAEGAGLFQVQQVSVFSAAADFLLSRTTAPKSNQTQPAASAPLAANSAPIAPGSAPNAGGAAPKVVSPAATPASALASNGAVAPATPQTPAPASNLNAQQQLQALNNALAALGLPPSDFVQIDRIASLIKDFNPTAFTDLVYQLAALANATAVQAASQPTDNGTNAVNAAAVAGNNPATAAASNNAATAGGGLHIQELIIQFSGVQAQGTTNAAANGNNSTGAGLNFQVSAFNLQIQEVNLTLANNAGQTTTVTAPLTAANSAPNVPTAPAPKAQAAVG